MPNGKWNFSTF